MAKFLFLPYLCGKGLDLFNSFRYSSDCISQIWALLGFGSNFWL